MVDERIEVLKNILLDLHHGAKAEAVQEEFNKHFTGVSAIEISLMEHELMNSDTGVTFEDVMSLCNVHANLFKGAVRDVEVADTDHSGHPVQIFKQENLALRAALMRVGRLLDTYANSDEEMQEEIRKGLKRQLSLVEQFERHYKRKEELMFPIMESYGHDSPPKVMWGVDDQIRELFKEVKTAAEQLPALDIEEVAEKFRLFATEFEAMIFKEESILLMILLESFTQDDWLKIAEESDVYGYAIIQPAEKWIPHRHSFSEKETDNSTKVTSEVLARSEQTNDGKFQQVIDTPDGQVTISFEPKKKKVENNFDRQNQQPFGHGYLSVEQANLILNHLPMEITFVNKEDIFQYYNDSVPADEMIFKRTPGQVGRNVELCHPPKFLEKVRFIFKELREGKRDKFVMWFKSESRGKFVHVTYAAVHDEAGEFQGVLEYVQDIQPFREIDGDVYRGLD
ncbi:DUF438 domain-containing protein [Streptococcus constellatus subsp. pharyngis]|uniref:Hemerythrin HHE cation binding domain protein n=1 Tax=Streptococcus constellatus subsp. pharyngis SK1060 = CCUG 46377 TaxID=1035184 RepID=F9P4I7_STRCV|nr:MULTISPECIES: DUF438 domain-containing protein [Streptococcus]AGU72289.1 hypothetical protein SCRE_0428 [Streptococcus constellatus subsp. pharyngis C232]AGU74045.1 hypothetical protein SCR2_0428 [Streptococcus constellatus subsp. pharyngis C818]AGU79413.1 hypothetical protein SCI_0448 [Streptococcus constellatus subsp. pharyngis C1050]EGV10537.1 hypothetical protein HMPREF1042_0384 [Streptococcus constellatus subsp. pharyngis SK1060 = CCUG 46377]QRP81743.1 DUF438 domain-containing protein 